MGRKKIRLRRIECLKERSSKYSKRKKGLLKKAEEMTILCDVDIIMLLYSPTEKPTLFLPPSRSFSDIVERLYMISPEDREERRDYTIKTLKKAYKNNTEILSENHNPKFERNEEMLEVDDKVTELRKVKQLLANKMSILRDWQNPCGINDLSRLNIMEKYLVFSLSHISRLKTKDNQ